MKIGIWKTSHEIADTVAEAVYEGLKDHCECRRFNTRTDIDQLLESDVQVIYGILRGASEVFKLAQAMGKPYVCIDRGYWKPGHYEGYYRISLNGTQQTTGLDKFEPDYERWDALGLEISDVRNNRINWELIVPPTTYANDFFGLSNWSKSVHVPMLRTMQWRTKQCDRPLQNDLDNCCSVTTFNSSVGWEALRQGIPVFSDENHSFVGAYKKQVDKMPHMMDIESRRRLFAVQCGLQLTLEEVKSGKIWPLLQRLLQCGSA